jgi:MoaA/NifB/PqqE/SkfB family radical SAM enzyme
VDLTVNHDEHLLEPALKYVMLELTSRCNLRCVYCAVSQPDFHGLDITLGFDRLRAELGSEGGIEIQMNGHGETTIVRNWDVLARELMDDGHRLSLTSNLAIPLRDEELSVIRRMSRVTVSLDTCDPELLARLRRGSRLEKIEANLKRIRAGGSGPYVAINCTFTDKVMEGLPALVDWAAAHDLQCLALTNLVEYPQVDPEMIVRHPAEVDPVRALALVREARERATRQGLDFHAMDGLQELLVEASARWPAA